MRLSWVKTLSILLIMCAILHILEANKSKKSKKEFKNKHKPDKGRPHKPGKIAPYTEPVDIVEKTELDSDNVNQNQPGQNLTQSILNDDHSKDSKEDEDSGDKKKKKTTMKPHRITARTAAKTTTEYVVVTRNLPANLTSFAGAFNATTPLNSSENDVSQEGYGQHHYRYGHEGHRGDGHRGDGRMPCAMGHTKFEKVEKDISTLWGYVQGISQPVHVHVHNEDDDMEVDRSPRGHSEVKHSKQKKEREEKEKSSKQSKKGMRADVQDIRGHHSHSRHHQDHIHSHHHHHTKHNYTDHHHSHHDHTKHNYTDHHHSHHHAHTDQRPRDVLGHLDLSKLGKGRETHIHIHIHMDDKGDKPNKGDEHHKNETQKSEQDDKPLYATCDLRNNDPNHNISGTITLRQSPGQQLEVRIQVQGFAVPVTPDGPTPDGLTTDEPIPDDDIWGLNISNTDSRIPVVSQHGFHVHEYGDFSKGCASFGGHFNPEGVTHGHRNGGDIGHVGDWGNIDVDANGEAFSNFQVKSASLSGQNSIIGRGIVIHAKADDLGEGHTEASKTTGDAGGRIACCTVALAKPQV